MSRRSILLLEIHPTARSRGLAIRRSCRRMQNSNRCFERFHRDLRSLPLCVQQFTGFVKFQRLAPNVALNKVALVVAVAQKAQLAFVFNAFANDVAAHQVAHIDDRADKLLALKVAFDVVHKAFVDFKQVYRKLFQI